MSFELGLRKPDRKIYDLIIKHIGLPAGNIIYTDDRKELVDPARQLGIDALVFKSPHSFKSDLKKRNVLLGSAKL